MCRYTNKDLENIKRIILGERIPSRWDYFRYDVNNDGKITSMDYVMIKNRMTK